jgi:hypothetical protein
LASHDVVVSDGNGELCEAELDIRMRVRESFQKSWAVEPRRDPKEPKLDHAAGRRLQRLNRPLSVRDGLEGGPRLRQERLACLREADAVRVALQKLHSELVLQLGDRLRKGWLGEVELERGPRHLPLLRDRDEVLHVPQPGHSKPSPLVSEPRRDGEPQPCPP